ncbi:MAG: GNAT family N-acetyltransferase [Treponema sp.]|jgi:predicted acetyltransferase|nr:GNAT family N-acetyltransferase [Treponema sp.]
MKLYLKPANMEDIEKEFSFVSCVPADENGFINTNAGMDFETFKQKGLPGMIAASKGEGLPEGYVPETFYFLWFEDDESSEPVIVGEFRLRHNLTPSLEKGSGHVGQFIGKDFRGRGFCTEGLRLLVEEAKKIVPENELYLHCNLDNQSSLRVMLKNGGVIHHKNENGYFVRIKLR